MKNKHYYPVAHALDIEEIISIMCDEPSEETLTRMDEEFLPLTDFTRKDRRAARRKATVHKKSRRETLARSLYERYDELKENNYHDDELLAIHHSYCKSYIKPESISKARYENNEYFMNDDTPNYLKVCPEDFCSLRTLFNSLVRDYLDCGNNIEPRTEEGYLIHIDDISFHVNNPFEAYYYLYGYGCE